jgi:hypothetical protein
MAGPASLEGTRMTCAAVAKRGEAASPGSRYFHSRVSARLIAKTMGAQWPMKMPQRSDCGVSSFLSRRVVDDPTPARARVSRHIRAYYCRESMTHVWSEITTATLDWSVAWSSTGRIANTNGQSIEGVDRASFGTVSAADAVNRLADGGGAASAATASLAGPSLRARRLRRVRSTRRMPHPSRRRSSLS